MKEIGPYLGKLCLFYDFFGLDTNPEIAKMVGNFRIFNGYNRQLI